MNSASLANSVYWVLALSAFATAAAAEPYGFGDISLGASYQRLAAVLDFRDINAAIAEQKARGRATPDLGRRGYGCMRRDDASADVTCVSHEEKAGGAPTREIRLQFLEGMLQQFSITAEIAYRDAVIGAVSARHGAPQMDAAARPPLYRWDNGESRIVAVGGKDLVFVSFELSGYAAAVERKGSGAPSNACR